MVTVDDQGTMMHNAHSTIAHGETIMMSARRPTRSHPIAAIAVLILILCGCQQSVPPGPPTARVSSGGGVIAWTRDPAFVLFRAEIVGGEAFAAMSQVPLCTLYGDNRIVWTDITDTRDANVLEDRLSDAVISTFIAYLTVNERIYTFEEKLTDRATSGNTMPIVERVTIAVNDTVHRANGLSGWESGWFERVLSACRNLSAAPVLIAPAAGWLSAREVAFTVEAPLSSGMPSARESRWLSTPTRRDGCRVLARSSCGRAFARSAPARSIRKAIALIRWRCRCPVSPTTRPRLQRHPHKHGSSAIATPLLKFLQTIKII